MDVGGISGSVLFSPQQWALANSRTLCKKNIYIKEYALAQVRLHCCDAMRLSGRRGTTEESVGHALKLLEMNTSLFLSVSFACVAHIKTSGDLTLSSVACSNSRKASIKTPKHTEIRLL